jgi:acyl carrier protein
MRMEERLLRVFQQSFGLEHIDDSMSIENVNTWDSMAHVGLMMALQQEFGVSIAPAEAIELTDVGTIKAFLRKRGIE